MLVKLTPFVVDMWRHSGQCQPFGLRATVILESGSPLSRPPKLWKLRSLDEKPSRTEGLLPVKPIFNKSV
jgi:hypothetical protein